MKAMILMATLLSSSAVFAISDLTLTTKCSQRGKEKIAMHADSYNCNLTGTMKVSEVDNRLMVPYKYIWYKQEASCEDGNTEITAMVQYDSLYKECI